MRFLHVSDLHARPAWYQWLVDVSSNYELVCLTGDLLNLGDYDASPIEQAATVLPYLRAIRQRTCLAICSGNHDVLPLRGFETAQWMESLRDEGVYADGDNFSFCDYRFRCLAWCAPVPQDIDGDFCLIHVPPYGARTSTVPGGVSHGCEELRAVCLSRRDPMFTLSGHVHASLGFCDIVHRTTSLNPGQGDHPDQPSSIVIDIEKRTVTHHRATQLGVKSTTINFPSNAH